MNDKLSTPLPGFEPTPIDTEAIAAAGDRRTQPEQKLSEVQLDLGGGLQQPAEQANASIDPTPTVAPESDAFEGDMRPVYHQPIEKNRLSDDAKKTAKRNLPKTRKILDRPQS